MAGNVTSAPDSSNSSKPPTAVLATAIIKLLVNNEVTPSVRALCDTGAQINLITERCVQQLGLKNLPSRIRVKGLGGEAVNNAKGMIIAKLCQQEGRVVTREINLMIVPKVATTLPSKTIYSEFIEEIDDKKLADSDFCRPAKIDILLGAGIWAEVIEEKIFRSRDGLVAQESKLGWLVFGEQKVPQEIRSCYLAQLEQDTELESALRRLWENDEIKGEVERTPEERRYEEFFSKNHKRNKDGRYIVKMPLKLPASQLGDSDEIAKRRFLQLEKRLERDPELKRQYVEYMRNLIANGYIKEADRDIPHGGSYCAIPHHPVAVDKKFRVVFDASCRTTSGLSLNDIQMSGPKVQANLFDIVLEFRVGAIAFSADIVKMYLQVLMDPDDWDMQRIWWRESPDDKLIWLWILVVIFGMRVSGDLAVSVLIQLAKDCIKKYPQVLRMLMRNFYMDDVAKSVHTLSEAKSAVSELTNCLKEGGFELAKWTSNRQELFGRPSQPNAEKQLSEGTKTSLLGLIWCPEEDTLKFRVNIDTKNRRLTKRKITSEAAKIYDPIGFLAPVTIQAKMFIQNLWRVGMVWDEQVSDDIAKAWNAYYSTLAELSKISIPRWMGSQADSVISLHGFADASERGYGAVVYARVVRTDGDISVSILAAKSKLAPVQTLTTPRLELLAATLLVRLMESVTGILELENSARYFWSDSEIVLHWIRKFPCTPKTFVAHRVAEIQAKSEISQWRHVVSEKNPADLVSRGVTVSVLTHSSLWWNGPPFLAQSEDNWPEWLVGDLKDSEKDQHDTEQKPRKTNDIFVMLAVTGQSGEGEEVISRRSTLSSVLRITLNVMRFASNCQNAVFRRTNSSGEDEPKKSPTMAEALAYWIISSQQKSFGEELKAIAKGNPLRKDSSISSLTPFVDKNNVMRARGRLANSTLTYDEKHPIVLSAKSELAKKLIAQTHLQTLHGGAQLTMQVLRSKYWMVGMRQAVKAHIAQCTVCYRQRQRIGEQLMGDLPALRVTPARAFLHCGVDYAGPVTLKLRPGRFKITFKGYVDVFICLSTRAIHLEVVGDLTTEAFLAAFDRLVGRRGAVSEMRSDNGTTFVGADNVLTEIRQTWESSEMSENMSTRGTNWLFIPPGAPHQGGIWEAAVKSMKHHLRRVIGRQVFTFEQLMTLLVRIEACLNSRPLSALSDDPTDLVSLTPGHFLIGEPLVRPLGEDFQHIPTNRLKIWQQIQKLEQDFWRRWHTEYLQTLQRRNKWRTVQPNITVGTLVLIKDDNSPPTVWPMGRITSVNSGPDGLVRSASVRTATTTLERPVQKLCILPMRENST